MPGICGADVVINAGAAVEVLDNLEWNAVGASGFGVALLVMICSTVFPATCSPGEVNRGSAASLSCEI